MKCDDLLFFSNVFNFFNSSIFLLRDSSCFRDGTLNWSPSFSNTVGSVSSLVEMVDKLSTIIRGQNIFVKNKLFGVNVLLMHQNRIDLAIFFFS